MRKATAALLVLVGACTDLRDYRGDWHGHRIGESASVRVGVSDRAEASLAIDTIDSHGISATLEIDALVPPGTTFRSLEGAEADKLANMTFAGESPIRVYLGFVAPADTKGDAMVMIALYDDRRIEVRLLRGGTNPLYGIFELSEAS